MIEQLTGTSGEFATDPRGRCKWAGVLLLVLAGCGPEQIGSTGGDGGEECPGRPDSCWVELIGTSENDTVLAVAVDPGGNLVVAGHTLGDLTGGPVSGSFDVFVSKRCPDGAEVWTRQFGGDDVESAFGIDVDPEGNIYVTGQVASGYSRAEAFVAKYTPEGDQEWLALLGSEMHDLAFGIDVNPGAIHIVGTTEGSLGSSSHGGRDAFIATYTPDGALLWVVQLGSEGDDAGRDVTVDASGNVYLAGTAGGPLDGNAAFGGSDILLAKYDGAGTLAWTRLVGSPGDDEATALAVSPGGDVYVTGVVGTNGLDGNPGLGGRDAFLIRFGFDGTRLWTEQFGTESTDYGIGVAIGDDGNVLVAGSTWGVLLGQTSAGESDNFLLSYAPAGTRLSTRQFGTAQIELSSAMALDGADVYLGGLVGSTIYGEADAFVMRVCD